MRRIALFVTCLALAACNSGSSDDGPPAAPRYAASRVDNSFFGTNGINGRGDVAGYGGGVPLITWDGNLEKLPKPGDTDVGQAVALNDSKQVAGFGQKGPQISRTFTGFLMTGGVMQLLPNAIPTAMNNRGDVVGFKTSGDPGGFLFMGNAMIDLPGPNAGPVRIKDRGEVTGSYRPASPSNPDLQQHPFIYSGGKLTDLGVVGTASDINASGDVVGTLSSVVHAFLYTKGQVNDLGAFGGTISSAAGIDDNGRIVGFIDGGSQPSRTFLYAQGTVYDLKALIVSGVAPEDLPIGTIGIVDMSGNGQILATICAVDCKTYHTYLLRPM
jgi:probable HAF family extracellular repeat protein